MVEGKRVLHLSPLYIGIPCPPDCTRALYWCPRPRLSPLETFPTDGISCLRGSAAAPAFVRAAGVCLNPYPFVVVFKGAPEKGFQYRYRQTGHAFFSKNVATNTKGFKNTTKSTESKVSKVEGARASHPPERAVVECHHHHHHHHHHHRALQTERGGACVWRGSECTNPPAGMAPIDLAMVRRRAEHNEGMVSTLEEISLHQQEIEKIEGLGQLCRHLKILYLQNNLVAKLQNMHRLKELEYANFAVNNIVKIENLQRCESLVKLDLTVNFISKASLLTVHTLDANVKLEDLYLMGNPCADFGGYRAFILGTLPQLKKLDGTSVTPSERILAKQELPAITERLLRELRAEGVDVEEAMRVSDARDLAPNEDDVADMLELPEDQRPWCPATRVAEQRVGGTESLSPFLELSSSLPHIPFPSFLSSRRPIHCTPRVHSAYSPPAAVTFTARIATSALATPFCSASRLALCGRRPRCRRRTRRRRRRSTTTGTSTSTGAKRSRGERGFRTCPRTWTTCGSATRGGASSCWMTARTTSRWCWTCRWVCSCLGSICGRRVPGPRTQGARGGG